MPSLLRLHPMAIKPEKLSRGIYLIKSMNTVKIPPHGDDILQCGYAVSYSRFTEKVVYNEIVAEPDSSLRIDYPESLRPGEVIKLFVHNNLDTNNVILRGRNICIMKVLSMYGTYLEVEDDK